MHINAIRQQLRILGAMSGFRRSLGGAGKALASPMLRHPFPGADCHLMLVLMLLQVFSWHASHMPQPAKMQAVKMLAVKMLAQCQE